KAAGPGELVTAAIPGELLASLDDLARTLKVSTKAVFLAAYVDLVARETGASPVTVGVVSNGRSARLSNPLQAIGLFWNIVPFCVPLEPRDELLGTLAGHRELVAIE